MQKIDLRFVFMVVFFNLIAENICFFYSAIPQSFIKWNPLYNTLVFKQLEWAKFAGYQSNQTVIRAIFIRMIG
jgi:hypothetical protein